MKEYLTKNSSGNYQLVNHRFSEDDIEVPEGANKLTKYGMSLYFWDTVRNKTYVEGAGWKDCDNNEICTFESYIEDSDVSVVWQRESLNDKIATAEVARQQSKNIDATLAERQSQYGSFEDVAFVTENIMSTLAKARSNGLQDLPHTHRMALYMIASKMARIVNGDFNHLDSWHDIGGYSKLIEDLITDSVAVDW